MQSPQERKKARFAKSFILSLNAEMKKYEELYLDFSANGYTRELAESYADTFVNGHKKPIAEDIVQTAALFNKVRDYSSAEFYLLMLADKKLSGDERYGYCIESLKNKSLQGHWRDAEDFRTENINFMQNHSEKVTTQQRVNMYIALALVDCAAKNYSQAFRMLTAFGYKPQGKNDKNLLEILITGVYICAKSEEKEGLEAAVENAYSALKLCGEFELPWLREYYEKRIEDAQQGIL